MADSRKVSLGEMSEQEVSQTLYELIADSLSVDIKDIKDESNFVEDLGADSLDIVELVMVIEKNFDIEIPDEEAEKISTVRDAIDHIIESKRR